MKSLSISVVGSESSVNTVWYGDSSRREIDFISAPNKYAPKTLNPSVPRSGGNGGNVGVPG